MRIATIVIVALALLAGGYFGYQKLTTSSTDIVVADAVLRDGLPGAEIVAQLKRLPSELNTSVFAHEAYARLIDGSIVLSPMAAGKTNPFAPIPSLRTTPLKAR